MWFDSFLQVWEGDRLAKCINVANLKKKHGKIHEDGKKFENSFSLYHNSLTFRLFW